MHRIYTIQTIQNKYECNDYLLINPYWQTYEAVRCAMAIFKNICFDLYVNKTDAIGHAQGMQLEF